MDINTFLEDKLKHSAISNINAFERDKLKKLGLADYIKMTLTSKKFRKWPVDEDVKITIDRIVNENIKADKPIPFVFPFGGYKHWSLENFPYADWAEFFFLSYYIEYLSRVAVVYKPGVILYLLSDDAAIELMNNVSNENQDLYIKSIQEVINEFAKYLPENIKLKLVRTVPDLYKTREEYYQVLTKNRKVGEEMVAKLDEAKYKAKYVMSEFNLLLNGKENLTNLNDEEKKKKIINGMILHDCVVFNEKRGAFVRGGDKILLFTTKIPNGLALGMTKTSIAKFWTGMGILEDRGADLQERVLSPEQIKALKPKMLKNKVNVIPIKGFDEIYVYNGQLNYKK